MCVDTGMENADQLGDIDMPEGRKTLLTRRNTVVCGDSKRKASALGGGWIIQKERTILYP